VLYVSNLLLHGEIENDTERGNKNQRRSPARNEWGFSRFKEIKMKEEPALQYRKDKAMMKRQPLEVASSALMRHGKVQQKSLPRFSICR
jgi:hypothetical protein